MISRESFAYTYIDDAELLKPRELAILSEIVHDPDSSAL
jgi:hypothetical protein